MTTRLAARPKVRPSANTNGNGEASSRANVRTTIEIRGAREHNLKNVTLQVPRDQLVVVTGLSGSGKSSLAFDTIYAEGQRRYMESLSTFAKRFITQVRKPDVDFVFGLSPVISIEQKTVGRNPRSTVGTMTDIAGYLNLLFSTIGVAHCPYCKSEVPVRTKNQILEQLLALPEGTMVELRAPVYPVYGEDFAFLFAEIRKKGYRRMRIDGKETDISEDVELDESTPHGMEVIVDKFAVSRGIEKQVLVGIQNALMVGEQFIRAEVVSPKKSGLLKSFGCAKHSVCVGDLAPEYFMFNLPFAACRTCLGLGTYMQVHPDLLVPDKSRSIRGGCFIREAFNYNADNWDGRQMYSLSQHYQFSLDTPWEKLPKKIQEILLNGTPGGEKFKLMMPPGSKVEHASIMRHIGKPWGFRGIAKRIEHHYKRYRQKQVANSGMEAWLEKVMVEHTCPDCNGSRLKQTRMLFTINDKTIHDVGEINFAELREFLDTIKFTGRGKNAGQQVLREIRQRLDLLLGIGLDYLNFNRRSGTLSGGESQRIRLSTQIGSGLMGMLYVLDEPSIGLHPKDNVKMIATLRRLRDLGNTVIVVEHDEDTIRAADHVVEMGPGPGVHGGEVVVQGKINDILSCKGSPTGQYLSGTKEIRLPDRRRPGTGKKLVVRGARENNLKDIDVEIPLQQFVCITGASGSGKSTLVNDILFKRLCNALYDTRVLFGDHDSVEGIDQITNVINIDQSAIGRSSRSNPATYIGFYDDIRTLFANVEESKKRGYTAGRFSFNVKTGRCAECQG